MIRMFDLTSDLGYLNISMLDEAYMYQYWSETPCNGGMYQDIVNMAYKNAISNELYMLLVASLHNRIPGDTVYLAKAKKSWEWFKKSGMINSDKLVNDGLAENNDGSCFNNKGPIWTYNQGVILGALTGIFPPTHFPRVCPLPGTPQLTLPPFRALVGYQRHKLP